VTEWTAQYSIQGRVDWKGAGVNGCTECVCCEYFYWKSRLLKHRANRECLSLLFVAALFVLFVTNNGSVLRNTLACSCNHSCSGKLHVLDTQYYGCVYLSLVIKQATIMCRIFICGLPGCTIFSSAACPAVQYFPTLSDILHDFRKSGIEYKMFVLNLYTSVWNIFRSKKTWAWYSKNINWTSRKVTGIIFRF